MVWTMVVFCLSDVPRVAQLLQSLTSVARFNTIVLFLSNQEKHGQFSFTLLQTMCACNVFLLFIFCMSELRELFHQVRVHFSNLPGQAMPDTSMLEEQFKLI